MTDDTHPDDERNVEINACAVMDAATEALTSGEHDVFLDSVVGLIRHQYLEHTHPPIELSPKEMELIKLAVTVGYALDQAIEDAA